MFDEFFRKAEALSMAGVPFATATVVWADRPTSGKPGDRAIVTVDGTMYGWIGGSCAQPTVVREAVRAIRDGATRLVRLSPDPDAEAARPDLVDVPMTCYSGGTLEIFIEPHRPAPRLLIVGHLPVARSLAELGRALSYRVIVVDPDGREPVAGADERLSDLAGIRDRVTPLTFAVVATHGEHDEPALEELLETDVPYIGLIASRDRGSSVREALAARGAQPDQLGRIKFPAGLDIGAQRGDEIALSVIAEIVQTRRAMGDVRWEDSAAAQEPDGVPGAGSDVHDGQGDGTALDPVCGMTVEVVSAKASVEHAGTTYYFCCPGCAARFQTDPNAFIQ